MSVDKTGEKETRPKRGRRLVVTDVKTSAAPELDTAEMNAAVTAGKGRATPSRRHREEEEADEGGILQRTSGGLIGYLQGVRSEIGKVSFPTREETIRLTTIVLIALIVASLILGAISLMFTELFRIGLDQPMLLLGFMVITVAVGFFLNRFMSSREPLYMRPQGGGRGIRPGAGRARLPSTGSGSAALGATGSGEAPVRATRNRDSQG